MTDGALLPDVKPIADGDPCGPDLETEGDREFMSALARMQGELPRSYLSYLYPATEDDRVVIEFPLAFTELKALTSRSHDLRLIVVRARYEILRLDLKAFSATVGVIASLLTTFWDEVHPRAETNLGPEDGPMDRRRTEIAALDEPAVTFALQYAPIYEDRRVGRISARSFMYAQGKAKPRSGEKSSSEADLIDKLKAADKDEIEPTRRSVAALVAAVTQIRTVWQERAGESPPLDKLLELATTILGLIDRALPPPAGAAATDAAAGTDVVVVNGAGPAATAPLAGIASSSDAGEALDAVARYFSRVEPSSPALPLIGQAAALRGKSFYEALQALLPKHAEQAAFKIGTQSIFELVLSRAAKLDGNHRDEDGDDSEGDKTAPANGASSNKAWAVETRQQAIAMMGQISLFTKRTEPSSPIPWLLDRATDLAERDFMSLLGDVLPKAALRDLSKDSKEKD